MKKESGSIRLKELLSKTEKSDIDIKNIIEVAYKNRNFIISLTWIVKYIYKQIKEYRKWHKKEHKKRV